MCENKDDDGGGGAESETISSLHGSVSSLAGGLCLQCGLCVLARVQPHRRVVLQVRDPRRIRVGAHGALLVVRGAAARPVPHRLQAWVVHGHRLPAPAAHRHSRCVLNLLTTTNIVLTL